MKFGKIDYINLLPFHVYLKKLPLQNAFKKGIEYNKGVPSEINKKLYLGLIDGAIISSVESEKRDYKKLDFGISAYKRVDSVLIKKNTPNKKDKASATSNALADVLGLEGEIIIGDRALRKFIKNPDDYIDLVKVWHKRTNLPFVFARFCVRKNVKFYKKLSKNFLKQNVKIPQYILEKYSKSRQISKKDILAYLELIHYPLEQKQKRGLKKFLKKNKS